MICSFYLYKQRFKSIVTSLFYIYLLYSQQTQVINKIKVMFIAVMRLFKCFRTHRNEHINLQLIYSSDLIGTHPWLIERLFINRFNWQSLPHERGLILKLLWLVFPVWLLRLDQLSYPQTFVSLVFILFTQRESFYLQNWKVTVI